MKSFKKIQLSDDAVSRFQDNVEASLDQLTRLAIVDGNLIENISLVSGSENQIAHGLGRKPRLWFVARRFQNAQVWETANSATNTLLTLNCSASVTVSLWVA